MTADQLRTVNICEFCGHSTKWALSTALKKPEWTYRLASHMTLENVRDLMAVLSTASTVAQANVGSGSDTCALLGLEVRLTGRRPIEIDLAAYFPHPTGAVVIGEVKGHKPIDANDVSNLATVQIALESKKITTVVLFSTLKDELNSDELRLIREFAERRAKALVSGRGQLIPHLPLVLTGRDVSLPWGDDAHPWRWNTRREAPGLFGTAIASCRRNLGLVSYVPADTDNRDHFVYDWGSVGDIAVEPGTPLMTYSTGRSAGPSAE